VAEAISKMTILEVSALIQTLKTKLNIQDTMPMMPMAGMAAAAPVAPVEEEEEEIVLPEEPVQTLFTVKLTAFDASKKVKLVKVVKTLMPDFNLVMAKKFVDGVPAVIRDQQLMEEAEEIKKEIVEAGGTVEIV